MQHRYRRISAVCGGLKPTMFEIDVVMRGEDLECAELA